MSWHSNCSEKNKFPSLACSHEDALDFTDCMLKKCTNLRKFIKFKMGKWLGFGLGKLHLFSHVNGGSGL